jgi:hypothetical protein
MKGKIIETLRSVPITDKTYEEYIEALAERLLSEGAVLPMRKLSGVELAYQTFKDKRKEDENGKATM